MTLHMIKLSVGSESVEDHAEWQAANRQFWRKICNKRAVFHTTFQTPSAPPNCSMAGRFFG